MTMPDPKQMKFKHTYMDQSKMDVSGPEAFDNKYQAYISHGATALKDNSQLQYGMTCAKRNQKDVIIAKSFDALLDMGKDHNKRNKDFFTAGWCCERGSIPDCSVVISELSDGSLYLADFSYSENKKADFAGLVYMSLGAILMQIQPEGVFYIAAVEDRFRAFARILFRPLDDGIIEQYVYRASHPVR